MGFVLLWYGLMQFITQQVFNVSLYDQAIPRDLAANLILGAILYGITRNLCWYLPTVAVVMTVIHLSNAGKIVVLGGPIMPDDFLAVRNLFLLLEGWQLFAIIAIVAIPLLLLIAMIAWRRTRTWILLSSVSIAAAALIVTPVPVVHAMDDWFGNVVWNQRGNFEDRGLLIHLMQETARYLAHGKNPPTPEEVESAMTKLQQNPAMQSLPPPANNMLQRNVHVIVLESFWEPSLLTAAGLSDDPLDPEFRALWRETGNSHALSPVFGGYTANTEFEVLCGFPVTEDSVFFEGGLRHDVPCLPRLLDSEGYRTIASHPNIAAFWNRVNAYQRIGFDTYWSINDFVSDDINRDFLSDSSMYRQVMEKTGPLIDAGQPVFNYILTIFGHLDYPLNAQRPAVIEASSGSKMVQDYANTIYYKSRELMAFLKILRARDPHGLIVLFGDHLPFLGPNFDGFTESGLLFDNRSKFNAEMFYTLVATPLIIIDGQKGPQKVGDVPVYQLPLMILDMLGNQQPSLMRMSKAPEGIALRPLPGMYFVGDEGERKVCHQGDEQSVNSGNDAACAETAQWVQALITLTRDLFNGRQYSLQKF
ncbi:MAG: LTA synthase family protein [Pseudomonadota bacterium]|nr:LTA synthase family protein [Pseudomonadota bacterium]